MLSHPYSQPPLVASTAALLAHKQNSLNNNTGPYGPTPWSMAYPSSNLDIGPSSWGAGALPFNSAAASTQAPYNTTNPPPKQPQSLAPLTSHLPTHQLDFHLKTRPQQGMMMMRPVSAYATTPTPIPAVPASGPNGPTGVLEGGTKPPRPSNSVIARNRALKSLSVQQQPQQQLTNAMTDLNPLRDQASSRPYPVIPMQPTPTLAAGTTAGEVGNTLGIKRPPSRTTSSNVFSSLVIWNNGDGGNTDNLSHARPQSSRRPPSGLLYTVPEASPSDQTQTPTASSNQQRQTHELPPRTMSSAILPRPSPTLTTTTTSITRRGMGKQPGDGQPGAAFGDCTVCMEARIDAVFVPCGHLACCFECGQRLANCPICCRPAAQCIKCYSCR